MSTEKEKELILEQNRLRGVKKRSRVVHVYKRKHQKKSSSVFEETWIKREIKKVQKIFSLIFLELEERKCLKVLKFMREFSKVIGKQTIIEAY